MSQSLVSVAYEFSPLQANLLRARLEAEGIECILDGDTLASVVGPLSHASASWAHPEGNIAVKVRREDEARAREILDQPPTPDSDFAGEAANDDYEPPQEREWDSFRAQPEYSTLDEPLESPLQGAVPFFFKMALAVAVAAVAGAFAEMYLGAGQLVAGVILMVLFGIIFKKLFTSQ